MPSDFGAQKAVPPLVDHDLISRRAVRVVMGLVRLALGLACWRAI